MSISDDAAVIAASNLVIAHVTATKPTGEANGLAARFVGRLGAQPIPSLFNRYLEMIQKGLTTLPDAQDGAINPDPEGDQQG